MAQIVVGVVVDELKMSLAQLLTEDLLSYDHDQQLMEEHDQPLVCLPNMRLGAAVKRWRANHQKQPLQELGNRRLEPRSAQAVTSSQVVTSTRDQRALQTAIADRIREVAVVACSMPELQAWSRRSLLRRGWRAVDTHRLASRRQQAHTSAAEVCANACRVRDAATALLRWRAAAAVQVWCGVRAQRVLRAALEQWRGQLKARRGAAWRERVAGRRPGLRAAWATWLAIAARGLAVARLRCAAKLRRRVGALHTWRYGAACVHRARALEHGHLVDIADHLALARRVRLLRAMRRCKSAAARSRRTRMMPRRCAESAACRRGLSALVGLATRATRVRRLRWAARQAAVAAAWACWAGGTRAWRGRSEAEACLRARVRSVAVTTALRAWGARLLHARSIRRHRTTVLAAGAAAARRRAVRRVWAKWAPRAQQRRQRLASHARRRRDAMWTWHAGALAARVRREAAPAARQQREAFVQLAYHRAWQQVSPFPLPTPPPLPTPSPSRAQPSASRLSRLCCLAGGGAWRSARQAPPRSRRHPRVAERGTRAHADGGVVRGAPTQGHEAGGGCGRAPPHARCVGGDARAGSRMAARGAGTVACGARRAGGMAGDGAAEHLPAQRSRFSSGAAAEKGVGAVAPRPRALRAAGRRVAGGSVVGRRVLSAARATAVAARRGEVGGGRGEAGSGDGPRCGQRAEAGAAWATALAAEQAVGGTVYGATAAV